MAFGDQMAPAAQGAPMQGTPPKTQEEFQGLHSGWMNFLTNPQTIAAMLQFSASVMQPVGRGQSTLGNIGLAMADAGMAAGRVGVWQANEDQRGQENAQRERQLATGEAAQAESVRANQATEAEAAARRAQDQSQFEQTLPIEQQRANAYSTMSSQYGQGSGASSAATPRDRAILQLQKTVMDMQIFDLMPEGFDVDGYYAQELDRINRLFPENAATMPVGSQTGAGGAPASVPGGETPVGATPTGAQPGSSASNPISITSPMEASKYPAGTWVRIPDGRTAQVK